MKACTKEDPKEDRLAQGSDDPEGLSKKSDPFPFG
jgi:hypothetical protein